MSLFKNSLIVSLSTAALLALTLPGFVAAQSGPVIQESTPAAAPAAPTENTSSEPTTTILTDTPSAPKPAPTPKPAPVARPVTTPAAPAEEKPAAPVVPAGPRLVNLAPPAQRFGDGKIYIGHRFYEEKGGGWGWIKEEGDSWSSAKWVALKEDPLRGIVMPSRKMGSRSADQDYEYKMTGRFSDKTAYDPHLDEALPIFIIESYQSLGPAKPIDRKPGPPERFTRSKKSRSSSRDDRPIISAPDSDSF